LNIGKIVYLTVYFGPISASSRNMPDVPLKPGMEMKFDPFMQNLHFKDQMYLEQTATQNITQIKQYIYYG
jgi:hypothetical protein